MSAETQWLADRLESALRAISPDLQVIRLPEGVLGGVISGPSVRVKKQGRFIAEVIVEDSETIWLGLEQDGEFTEMFVQGERDVEGIARRVARRLKAS